MLSSSQKEAPPIPASHHPRLPSAPHPQPAFCLCVSLLWAQLFLMLSTNFARAVPPVLLVTIAESVHKQGRLGIVPQRGAAVLRLPPLHCHPCAQPPLLGHQLNCCFNRGLISKLWKERFLPLGKTALFDPAVGLEMNWQR